MEQARNCDSDGISLKWKDLEFSVKVKGKQKRIVKSVSGTLSGGRLVAVLGPSGAGKTTFLNCLSGRAPVTSGRVSLDGRTVDTFDTSYRSRVAYVQQMDIAKITETPEELIRFALALRNHGVASKSNDLDLRVNEIISLLDLEKCRSTVFGSTMLKGLSGGEKKRTAIGIELATQPEILFLDEPTSGLDSANALSVVSTLRALADYGNAVLATIHQPSSEIFALFTDVIVLAEGRVAYQGPREEMDAFFNSIGAPLPLAYNPADWILSRFHRKTEEETSTLFAACEDFAYSKRAVGAASNSDKVSNDNDNVEGAADAKVEAQQQQQQRKRSLAPQVLTELPLSLRPGTLRGTSPTLAPFTTQLWYLSMRELRYLYRNVPALIARFAVTGIMSLIAGILFQNSCALPPAPGPQATPEELSAYQFRLQAYYGAITFIMVSGMFGLGQATVIAFPAEKPVFIKEYAARTYTASAYFLSKIPVDVGMAFIQCIFMWLIVYWLYALAPANFFYLTLVLMAVGLASGASAKILGAISPDITVAINLVPLVFVPQILFSGVFVPLNQIPEWLRWAQYLCALKYGVNLSMIIGWEGITQASDPVRYSFLTAQGIYPEEWYVSMVVLVALWVAFEAGAGIALIVYGSNLWKSSGTSTTQSHDGTAADEGDAGGSEKISKKAKSIKPPAVAGVGELV